MVLIINPKIHGSNENLRNKIEITFLSNSSLILPQKRAPDSFPTVTAHPARFSPEDKYSRHRLIIKKRFGLLKTQKKAPAC